MIFDVRVIMHREKFLTIRLTTCTNFSNLFLEWNSTCFEQFLCPLSEFSTVHTAVVFVIRVCGQLFAKLYDMYLWCVYGEKLLMMDRGTVQNI